MKKINLLVIATNQYTIFLKELLDSANTFFLINNEINYLVNFIIYLHQKNSVPFPSFVH